MPNLFASLPLAPAAVATDTMAARKAIIASGIFNPGDAVVVEVDTSGLGDWDVVKDETGQAIEFTGKGVRYANVLGFEMRQRRISSGGGAPKVDIGAEQSCPCQLVPVPIN